MEEWDDVSVGEEETVSLSVEEMVSESEEEGKEEKEVTVGARVTAQADKIVEALARFAVSLSGRSTANGAPLAVTHDDLLPMWKAVSCEVAPDGSAPAGALSAQAHEQLKELYGVLENAIISCGSIDDFNFYEVCFETLAHMGFFIQCQSSKELLFQLLGNVHEVYDVLLSRRDAGLLPLRMFEVIFACFESERITGALLMQLTDHDVAAAVSLIGFILKCEEAAFDLQATCARCLVELTSADLVFLTSCEEAGPVEELPKQQIEKLTGMLNRHVNGLIKGIIQFDLTGSFYTCICQHQLSFTETDIIIGSFLTTIHNCLLYCSENQKKLRQHLVTGSEIVQEIIIPYIDNILPLIYERENLVVGPTYMEWQNLKSALQILTVVTFNTKSFRRELRDGDMLHRLCQVPNILTHISMLELLITIAINVDFAEAPQPLSHDIANRLIAAFSSLTPHSQARLKRRLTIERSNGLPLARSSVKSVELLAIALQSPPLEAPEAAALAAGACALNARSSRKHRKALQYCSDELRNEKAFCTEVVKQNGNALKYCSKTLRNDKDLAIEAVKQSGRALQYCSETLRNDKDVAIEAVKQNGSAWQYCSETLRNDKDVTIEASLAVAIGGSGAKAARHLREGVKYRGRLVALEAVKRHGRNLKYCSQKLRCDKVVAMEAIKQDWRALQYCSDELRNDEAVCIDAVKRDCRALEYCPETLGSYKDIAKEAVKQSGRALQYCAETLRNDKDVAIEAVKQSGRALQYCAETLRNDKDVAIAAVKQSGRALQYCSESLRNDKDVATDAINQFYGALQYCSDELRNDRAFCIEVLNQNGSALKYCSETLRKDKDLAIEAIKQDSSAFQHCSDELRNDRTFCMEAINKSYRTLQYCSDELRNERAFCIEVLTQNGSALKYCSETLRKDKDVAMEAIKQDGSAFQLCSDELRNDRAFCIEALKSARDDNVNLVFRLFSKELQNDMELAMEALKSCYELRVRDMVKSLSKEMQNEKELAMTAVTRDGRALAYFSETLRNDKDLVKEAVKKNGLALELCSETLRNDKDVAIEAVKQNWRAIQYCSQAFQDYNDVAIEALRRCDADEVCSLFESLSKKMQNKNEVAMAALESCESGHVSTIFELLSDVLRNNKELAMEALKGCESKHVEDVFNLLSKDLQNKKEAAMMALQRCSSDKTPRIFGLCSRELQDDQIIRAVRTVRNDGLDLELCEEVVRNDKDVAIAAVKQNGEALQYCSQELRGDKDVAIEAVKQTGEALQYCSQELRGDKDVVVQAVQKSVTALKFALNGLNQDPECIKAAGFMKETSVASKKLPEKGILSVRFGFREIASNLSTVVADALAKHEEMSKLEIYNPNIYCKKSCDPNFTDLHWPCMGTASTCKFEQDKTTTDAGGRPTNNSCWRFSFRFHQEKCKESGGFMLQLEEQGQLGAGQEIETAMATELDLKFFRYKWKFRDTALARSDCRICISNQIADAILDWFVDEKRDTKMQIIEANPRYASKRFGGGW